MSVLQRSVWSWRKGDRGSLAMILTLALGISGVTCVFSIARGTPMLAGIAGSERLVWFMAENQGLGLRTTPGSEAFRALRNELGCCERIAAFTAADGAVRTEVGARPVRIGYVSREFFDLARGSLEVGRGFDASDYERAEDVAVVDRSLARSVLGGTRRALGRRITIDGRSLTVVGVAPNGYGQRVSLGERMHVLRPLEIRAEMRLHVVGRLREGVSLDQARAEVVAWGAHLGGDAGRGDEARWVLLPASEMLLDSASRRMLEIALLSGLLLVLVTAFNVAHLLAAEAERERREVATRWALGASRISLLGWKAARLLAVTVASALGAAALATVAIRIATSLLPENLGFLQGVKVELPGLLLAVSLSFVVVLCAAAFPLMARASFRLMEDLRGDPRFGRRPSSFGRAVGRIQLVSTIAVSLALAVGAYQVVRTAIHLRAVDVGFELAGLEAVEVALPEGKYRNPERRKAFFETFAARLTSVGALGPTAVARSGPLETGFYIGEIQFGEGTAAEPAAVGIGAAGVGPGYFALLRQPVLAGRGIVQQDLQLTPGVIVTSETAARQFGPAPKDAIGQSIRFGQERRRVVGVVADTRTPGSLQPFGASKAYWPLTQYGTSLTVLLRSRGSAAATVRTVAADLDPDVLVEIAPVKDHLARSLAGIRFLTTLFSGLTTLAIGLALLGVYGVLSSFVAREQPQIAMRMVMGANGSQVRSWILRKGLLPCVVGVAFGLLASYPLCRLLATQLHEVEVDDLTTRLLPTVLILGATFLASWLPAMRTGRVDPSEILRRG